MYAPLTVENCEKFQRMDFLFVCLGCYEPGFVHCFTFLIFETIPFILIYFYLNQIVAEKVLGMFLTLTTKLAFSTNKFTHFLTFEYTETVVRSV